MAQEARSGNGDGEAQARGARGRSGGLGLRGRKFAVVSQAPAPRVDFSRSSRNKTEPRRVGSPDTCPPCRILGPRSKDIQFLCGGPVVQCKGFLMGRRVHNRIKVTKIRYTTEVTNTQCYAMDSMLISTSFHHVRRSSGPISTQFHRLKMLRIFKETRLFEAKVVRRVWMG